MGWRCKLVGVYKEQTGDGATMGLANHRDFDDTVATDTLLTYSTIRLYPNHGIGCLLMACDSDQEL